MTADSNNNAAIEGCIVALGAHLQKCAAADMEQQPLPSESPLAKCTLPTPLVLLVSRLELSSFERDLLILCVAAALDREVHEACLQFNNGDHSVRFSWVFSVLPNAHWSAMSNDRPLRRWRLLHFGDGAPQKHADEPPIHWPLRVDQRILNHLLNISDLSNDLRAYLRPVRQQQVLPPDHLRIGEEMIAAWADLDAGAPPPVLTLTGSSYETKRQIAAAMCRVNDFALFEISARDLPAAPQDLMPLAMLWKRETLLRNLVLLISYHGVGDVDAECDHAVRGFLDQTGGFAIIASEQARRQTVHHSLILEVGRLPPVQQRTLWTTFSGGDVHLSETCLQQLTTQFNLDPSAIAACCTLLRGRLANGSAPEESDAILWDACRIQARANFADLARRITPQATWNSLRLPDPAKQLLRAIANQVRGRYQVHEEWGLGDSGRAGLGVTALFSGPSGCGKTMASEVLAHELNLDLYLVDLSALIDKYIGETQKNIRRVFDAAEKSGCILLFDEADALFSKRSEGKTSHDRHANNEISFLLYKMESYRGISILTTNFKEAIDTAFMRRLRFLVRFPFPDLATRRNIWRDVFPPRTPLGDINFDKLARLDIAGGNIRNIAVNACFLAAADQEPVRMAHLADATRAEYEKMEKPTASSDVRRLLS